MIFSKTNFGPTGVYILSSISRTLHNFSKGFFSLYSGILELKNDTSILRKNGSFANKRCCGLAALFVKAKIYFCHCNFTNKQTKIPSIVFSYRLQSTGRTQNTPENVFSFGNGIPNQRALPKNVLYQIDKLLFKTKYIIK